MKIIKTISFKDTPYEYYQYPILTADEEDRNLLDTSMTNIQGFHKYGEYNGYNWKDGTTPMMFFPKFHRGEKYQLPINNYSIKQYNFESKKQSNLNDNIIDNMDENRMIG